MENKLNKISEKEILIAAKEYSGIKADRNDYDEQYYNKQGCGKFDAFKAGVEWYQQESNNNKRLSPYVYQNVTEIIIIDKELKSLNKLKLDIVNSTPLTGLIKDDNFEIILHGKVKEMINNIDKLIEYRIETLKKHYN